MKCPAINSSSADTQECQLIIELLDRLFLHPHDRSEMQIGVKTAKILREHKCVLAVRCLAHAYENGLGVRKNLKTAFIYWKEAAKSGDVMAQSALAYAYALGRGTSKNVKKSVEWDKRAAAKGNLSSIYNLAQAYAIGSGIQLNMKYAVRYWKIAAQRGHTFAKCNLGVAYETGCGIRKNMVDAIRWYKRASADGDAVAQKNLDRINLMLKGKASMGKISVRRTPSTNLRRLMHNVSRKK